MARILCIEDSGEFQIYLSSILKDHTLTQVGKIGDALQLIDKGADHFDLILLDISLPDGNGMKALPRIREMLGEGIVPIIVISSDDDVLTKVAAFGIGADDYVNKPPDSSELRARIEAKLRWASTRKTMQSQLAFGDLILDTDKMQVTHVNKNGLRNSLDLTPFEFKILKILMQRPGQVYSRDQIVDRVWGVGKHITLRTVDTHVSHLRGKLNDSEVAVKTVMSAGYTLVKRDSSLGSESRS